MIVLIIVILLILLIGGLLFLPVSIVADSNRKMYSVSIPLYLKASFTELNEKWKIRFHIFHIPFSIKYPEKKKPSLQKGKVKKTRKKKRRKFSVNRILTIIKRTFKSFQIKQLDANIDTGDFPLNAQLIPVVSRLNSKNIAIGINFTDNNSIYFRAVTRLYKFVWIIIRYIIF
jgi:hypothetical protein